MTAPAKPVLSVIIPVYNEAETVAAILDQVFAFEYEPVDLEIVIIESNSTDGSRAIVEGFAADDSRVKLVLQNAPQGKGNAVRAGFEVATGDIILIQDGDLEYQVSDYPRLIDPILAGDVDFVLGCRHVRGQRIRDVPDQPIKGFLLNAAHWGFTGLFDMTYGVWLRDPFTMFKVFRSECIEGLPLEANRFDFDWELLGKLVRRGYKPVEVPITYQARSFHQGKKVRLFADPPTWVRACFRYRFSRIPKAVPRRVIADLTDGEAVPVEGVQVDLRATQVP